MRVRLMFLIAATVTCCLAIPPVAGASASSTAPTVVDRNRCLPIGVTSDDHGWISVEYCGGRIVHRRLG